MKIGKTMLMELKNSWRGYGLFIIVVVLLIAGFAQSFPAFNEAFEDELDGSENIEVDVIEEEEGVIVRLSWIEVDRAENYTLLVGSSPQMIVPFDRVTGIEDNSTAYHLLYDENEEIPETYFTVVAVLGEERETEFVGMETTIERRSPLEEFWGMDYGDIQGFVSVLWNMWWFLLISLYVGYISVNSVSKDFDEDRMDIILSKPISRKQYLLEKFSLVAGYTLSLMIIAGLVLIGSIYSVGELGNVTSSALMLSAVLSWPVFLVIIAVSLLAAVYLEDSKKAMGSAFIFILIQFGIHLVGDISESLAYVKHYTIISYWDHEAALYGEAISLGEVGLVIVIAVLIMLATLKLFERKDIPT
ncbi:MAG: ABC transporter permease subunit [Candidatus Saliniplasma sp.]